MQNQTSNDNAENRYFKEKALERIEQKFLRDLQQSEEKEYEEFMEKYRKLFARQLGAWPPFTGLQTQSTKKHSN